VPGGGRGRGWGLKPLSSFNIVQDPGIPSLSFVDMPLNFNTTGISPVESRERNKKNMYTKIIVIILDFPKTIYVSLYFPLNISLKILVTLRTLTMVKN